MAVMHKVSHYLKSHWRGEQSLSIAFFINYLLIYVDLIFLLIKFARSVTIQTFMFVGAPILILFLTWSSVGVFRTATKTMSNPDTSGKMKLLGIVAILIVAAVLLSAVDDYFGYFG